MNEKLLKIKEIAEKELNVCSAHDIDHVMRVYNIAMKLAKDENVDEEVIQAAILLHDIWWPREINDPTGNTDHAVESAKMALPILEDLWYSKEKIKHIQDCILSHRYRNWIVPKSREAEIVFDADKLDALWAIWTARAFVWVGTNKAKIYRDIDLDEYIKENLVWWDIRWKIKDKTKHCPKLMYETKDKYLIDKLYTEKAKEIARDRLEFSKNFHERLEREVRGEL